MFCVHMCNHVWWCFWIFLDSLYRCILDGEMLVWDTSTHRFAEFGSNQEIGFEWLSIYFLFAAFCIFYSNSYYFFTAKAAREGLASERQVSSFFAWFVKCSIKENADYLFSLLQLCCILLFRTKSKIFSPLLCICFFKYVKPWLWYG